MSGILREPLQIYWHCKTYEKKEEKEEKWAVVDAVECDAVWYILSFDCFIEEERKKEGMGREKQCLCPNSFFQSIFCLFLTLFGKREKKFPIIVQESTLCLLHIDRFQTVQIQKQLEKTIETVQIAWSHCILFIYNIWCLYY